MVMTRGERNQDDVGSPLANWDLRHRRTSAVGLICDLWAVLQCVKV
jgi:hypothetical protein